MSEILGLHPEAIFDAADFAKLSSRLVLNLLITAFVVVFVYVRRYGRTEYVFTYFMFNLITFSLCFLLRKVPVDMGFALGLFAVFGILRYRTEPIRTRDLTYLFIVIGIAILNAVVNKKVSLSELLLVNGTIAGLTLFFEHSRWFARDQSHLVIYDNMNLLKDSDQTALIADLRERTGLQVERIQIEQIDLLRDTARLMLFYPSQGRD